MKKTLLISSLSMLICASPLYAANTTPNFGVGVGVGTLGPQVKISTAVNPYFGLSASLSGYDYKHEFSLSNVNNDFDASYKIKTASLLANIFPFGGVFRVTGGAFYNGNEIDFNSGKNNININTNQYNDAKITGTADYNNFSPYLGIGWGNGINQHGFGFDADLGVLYQGNASVTLKQSGSTTISSADMAHVKKEIEDNANKLRFYPVASVDIHYLFA